MERENRELRQANEIPWAAETDLLPLERKYSDLGVEKLRRLKQLEQENARLKRALADVKQDN